MADRLPLAGIRVIDCSSILAGPMVATMLGDFGADVIKIEHPGRGDTLRGLGGKKEGVPLWWLSMGRNKRSVALDLHHAGGQDVLRRLAARADVLVENFRPGTLERWDIGWEALHALNPRLVMVRVTGFGQDGPYKDRAGFGTLAESMSGFAHITGFPDGPPTLPPLGLADSIAAMTGAYAVMTCLYERDRPGGSGEGQMIDLAIYEPMFAVLGPQMAEYDQLGMVAGRVGNRVPFAAPRNLYRTADGKWVSLSASAESMLPRILKAVQREDLIGDPRFRDQAGRVAHADLLDQIVGDWIGGHSTADVLATFTACEAAIAPVYDIADISRDPQFIHRQSWLRVEDPRIGPVAMPGVFPRLSRTPGAIRSTGPALGEHTEAVLREAGLTAAEIEHLRHDGAIGLAAGRYP